MLGWQRLLGAGWLGFLGAVAAPVCTAETHVVVAKGFRFEPEEITIKVGDAVRWENAEKRQFHSISFPGRGDNAADYFFPGETRERTFDKPGTYPYTCEPHFESHKMKGVVHVVE